MQDFICYSTEQLIKVNTRNPNQMLPAIIQLTPNVGLPFEKHNNTPNHSSVDNRKKKLRVNVSPEGKRRVHLIGCQQDKRTKKLSFWHNYKSQSISAPFVPLGKQV